MCTTFSWRSGENAAEIESHNLSAERNIAAFIVLQLNHVHVSEP